jgi:hypothetical protein
MVVFSVGDLSNGERQFLVGDGSIGEIRENRCVYLGKAGWTLLRRVRAGKAGCNNQRKNDLGRGDNLTKIYKL